MTIKEEWRKILLYLLHRLLLSHSKKEIWLFATKCSQLEIFMLTEISQSPKDKDRCVFYQIQDTLQAMYFPLGNSHYATRVLLSILPTLLSSFIFFITYVSLQNLLLINSIWLKTKFMLHIWCSLFSAPSQMVYICEDKSDFFNPWQQGAILGAIRCHALSLALLFYLKSFYAK